MSLHPSLPIPDVAGVDYGTPVVSTIGRNEPGNIPSARGEIACDVCGATGIAP